MISVRADEEDTLPSPIRVKDDVNLPFSSSGSEKREEPSSTNPSKSSTGPPLPKLQQTKKQS